MNAKVGKVLKNKLEYRRCSRLRSTALLTIASGFHFHITTIFTFIMPASKLSVLITGANAGLGLEIVKALCMSNHAYNIILAGRSPQKVKDAIKEVKSQFPQTQSTFDEVQIDVTDDDSISKAYEKVAASYDHLDCLVNNAGKIFRFVSAVRS